VSSTFLFLTPACIEPRGIVDVREIRQDQMKNGSLYICFTASLSDERCRRLRPRQHALFTYLDSWDIDLQLSFWSH
jgi:CMP-N-acetylneuraminic acid synthetase